MDISKYELNITKHAFVKIDERNIDLYLIYKTLYNGKIKRLGKHGIKFILTGNKSTIITVGHIIGLNIKIFTVGEK